MEREICDPFISAEATVTKFIHTDINPGLSQSHQDADLNWCLVERICWQCIQATAVGLGMNINLYIDIAVFSSYIMTEPESMKSPKSTNKQSNKQIQTYNILLNLKRLKE